MDNLDDLKALWHSAKTESLPSAKHMLQTVRSFRDQKLRRKWMVIVVSSLSCVLVAGVLYKTDFKLITTYIGGTMIAASSAWLAVTNIASLGRFYELDDQSNSDFLAFIEQTKKNQIYYYKKTQPLVMFLWSAGLLLYLYEVCRIDSRWFVGVYTICAVYILVMWFWVRPYIFHKEAKKLIATRERFENISKQLK